MRAPLRPLRDRRLRAWWLSAMTSLALTSAGRIARADLALTLPPSGGLDALAARVDLAAGTLHFHACPAAPCGAEGGASFPIGLDRSRLPDARAVVVEALRVGEGRALVHVRVPAKDNAGVAWEALLSGAESDAPIFAGATGYTRGEEGERSGEGLTVLAREGGAAIVAVGEIREDLRLCGQDATLLRPRVVDPAKMTLVGASLQRLPRAQRDAATPLGATARSGPAEAPLASLLVVAGASTALSPASALVDGDPSTAWAEARPGAGPGEFVVMRAPSEVRIARFTLTVSPASKKPRALAAPRTLYLVTSASTFAVTLPEDAAETPGAAFDLVLPEPIRASCISVILDRAYLHEGGTADVGLAELTAYSALDVAGAKLADLAGELASEGPRAEEASAILRRAGPDGLAAVARLFPRLDASGRARAADVAASASCGDGAPLLVRAMMDPDREVARKGREKLERCGRAAAPALTAALETRDLRQLGEVAPMLAMVAPSSSLEAIARALGLGSADVRGRVRSAFARAARSVEAPRIAALLRDRARDPYTRLELLRAASERLAELRSDAGAALADLLAGSPPMRARYLALDPMSALARAGDPDATRSFAETMSRDPDTAVRAHAAAVASRIPGLQGAVLAALHDPDPRVREAALLNVGEGRISAAAVSVQALLEADPWTFVRAAAASALGSMSAAPDIDRALAAAIADRSPRVRDAAISALGVHRASAYSAPLRRVLDDAREVTSVRAAAAQALASACDAASLDDLAALARDAASPAATEPEVTLGLAAADALGKIHPHDLDRRLAPLLAPGARAEARRAGQAARDDRGICH